MTFYSVRDLRTDTKGMWESLSSGNEVVITNNGKPAALMIDIPADSFDEVVQAVRQAKAMIAFNNMRRKAGREGVYVRRGDRGGDPGGQKRVLIL